MRQRCSPGTRKNKQALAALAINSPVTSAQLAFRRLDKKNVRNRCLCGSSGWDAPNCHWRPRQGSRKAGKELTRQPWRRKTRVWRTQRVGWSLIPLPWPNPAGRRVARVPRQLHGQWANTDQTTLTVLKKCRLRSVRGFKQRFIRASSFSPRSKLFFFLFSSVGRNSPWDSGGDASLPSRSAISPDVSWLRGISDRKPAELPACWQTVNSTLHCTAPRHTAHTHTLPRTGGTQHSRGRRTNPEGGTPGGWYLHLKW